MLGSCWCHHLMLSCDSALCRGECRVMVLHVNSVLAWYRLLQASTSATCIRIQLCMSTQCLHACTHAPQPLLPADTVASTGTRHTNCITCQQTAESQLGVCRQKAVPAHSAPHTGTLVDPRITAELRLLRSCLTCPCQQRQPRPQAGQATDIVLLGEQGHTGCWQQWRRPGSASPRRLHPARTHRRSREQPTTHARPPATCACTARHSCCARPRPAAPGRHHVCVLQRECHRACASEQL